MRRGLTVRKAFGYTTLSGAYLKKYLAFLFILFFCVAVSSTANAYTVTPSVGGGGSGAYQYLTQWGSYGSGNGQFNVPGDLGVDAAGNVYVVDCYNYRIQKFNSNGTYLTQWTNSNVCSGEQHLTPNQFAVDAPGNVYIATDHIQKFNSDGVLLAEFGYGYFSRAAGMTVDAAGNILVATADATGSTVMKFGSDGLFLTQWSYSGISIENMAVDAAGNIYIIDWNSNSIKKFTSNGDYVTQWGSYGSGNGQFMMPLCIAADAAGNVFVTDPGNNRVQKFDSNGTYLTQWGAFGTGPGQFNLPGGIVVDVSGNVYVCDVYNSRIQKFQGPTGSGSYQYVSQWGSYGSGSGQFNRPSSVGVDSAGNVYVVDCDNYRIQKFNSTGIYLTQWTNSNICNGQPSHFSGFAVDGPGNVYIAKDHIQKYSSNGVLLAEFAYGYFSQANGMAVDSAGNIYITNRDSGFAVLKFNSGGSLLAQWGTYGSGDGQFNHAVGIDVDATGNVYVVDFWNYRVQKFTSNGVFLTKWGSYGSGNGQFWPCGIKVDPWGRVLVTDIGNKRVQVFDSNGTYLTQFGSSGSGNGQFAGIDGIGGDAVGNVYVCDVNGNRIEKFQSGGSGGANGTISPSTPQTVGYGGTVMFTIMPDAGYAPVMSGTCGGTLSGPLPAPPGSYSYMTYPVYSDCTVHADFLPSPSSTILPSGTVGSYYSVALNQYLPGAGGMPPYSWSITSGSLPGGLWLDNWSGLVWGTPTQAGNFSFSAKVTDMMSISLGAKTFTMTVDNPPVLTITASAGPNGSISPSGDVTVSYGDDLTFTIAPDARYRISDVLVDGSSVGAVSSYTFSGVTADHTIQASFERLNLPPTASAGPDQLVTFIGATVRLDGAQSYDADGDPITYQWTFISVPTGSNATLNGADTAAPTFIADVHGSYAAQLVVSDPWTQSSPSTVTVSFNNLKPVANPGTSQSVVIGDTVTLDGSGSSDANNDLLTYRWQFTSSPVGSQAVITGSMSSIATFVPDLPGAYVAQLIVNDGFTDSDPGTIQIQAVTLQTVAVTAVQDAGSVIAALPAVPAIFQNTNMQNALLNKLNAVLANLEAGNYAAALGQIQNDILAKTDGCAKSGAPDKNDWIRDCGSQQAIYPYILDAIAKVKALMN